MNANMKSSKLWIPFMIALVGTVLMAVTVFLPYATATDKQAENLQKYPDTVVYEGCDMTAEDMMNISMAEYAKVYTTLSEQLWGNSSYGLFYAAFVVAIGVFSVLAVLFTCLKKPIAVIIFDILAFGVFSLQNWDYTDRGVIPSSSYDWGIGYYLFYAAAAIALIGSVWMLVNQIKIKKQHKADNIG